MVLPPAMLCTSALAGAFESNGDTPISLSSVWTSRVRVQQTADRNAVRLMPAIAHMSHNPGEPPSRMVQNRGALQQTRRFVPSNLPLEEAALFSA